MAWANTEIARQLEEIAELLRLAGEDAFRVRAYERAAGAVGAAEVDLAELDEDELTAVSGIGESTAAKIVEFADTGEIGLLRELREQVPPGVVELARVPGLGPKLARRLHAELGIDGLDDLAAALDDGRVAGLEGFG
ncbi:MAG: helix-hairpin-helix domain-containing protein, partial [Actinomycetota bacterium]